MDAASPAPPSLREFALVVGRVGLTSFGGGLSAWMMRIMVQERRWVSEADFLAGLAVCQVFPGINTLNLVIWLGYRMHGGRGALVGALAMIVPPGLALIGLAVAFRGLEHDVSARLALDGVAAAAVGLAGSMGFRAARRVAGVVPVAIMVGLVVALGVLRLPLVPVMVAAAPVSIFLAWRRLA